MTAQDIDSENRGARRGPDPLAGLDPAGLASEGLRGRLAPPYGLTERLATLLPDYEVGPCLGRGGMGVVFRARQRKLDRPVAVKVLLPAPEDAPTWAERFEREARALAKLNHPNIVGVYDFGRADDLMFLVMEYVDGASLRELLIEGKLTAPETLAIVPQLCDALQYAHSEGVVHRDIKPENILLDGEGNVRIADFGLAKIVGEGNSLATLTGSHQAMGTFRYMAPEQIDRPRDVDHRADLFSMGVVLYEMLTGEVPAGSFPKPSECSPVDERLDDVVVRALQHEPDRRYQQARELKSAVEDVTGSSVERAVSRPPLALPRATWFTPMLSIAGLGMSIGEHAVQSSGNAGGGPILDQTLLGPGVALGFLIPLVAYFRYREKPDALEPQFARVAGPAVVGASYVVWMTTSGRDASFTPEGSAYVILQGICATLLVLSGIFNLGLHYRARLARAGLPPRLHERLRLVSIFACAAGILTLFLPWGMRNQQFAQWGFFTYPGLAAGAAFVLCGTVRAVFEDLGMRATQGAFTAVLGGVAGAMGFGSLINGSNYYQSLPGAFIGTIVGVAVLVIGMIEFFLPAPRESVRQRVSS
ncbi:MAG: serine/threonine protein kinase [bacterium]|nr:serine/threonine protein kinase [bacterium]